MNRSNLIHELESTDEWDVIIIGGGATGLGILVEAANRGYRSILFEKGDFASQTSSASTKLIHVGIRYLKDFSISHLRESAREQSILRHLAPHLVSPLSFILPCRSFFEHTYFRSGLALFDFLTSKAGKKYACSISRNEVKKRIPNYDVSSLFSGIVYEDCQFDDARYAMSLCKTAIHEGAVALNYFEVKSFMTSASHISGVMVQDCLSGAEYVCRGKVVINAAGPFLDSVRSLETGVSSSSIQATQGIHIMLPLSFLGSDTAYIIPKTRKGKVLYAIPWKQRLLIGTTERVFVKPESNIPPLEEDISYLLEEISPYVIEKPRRSDITSVFSGLRPLIKPSVVRKSKQVSRDHQIFTSPAGLISIGGGKWTTYRVMARDVLQHAMQLKGIPFDKTYFSEVKMVDSPAEAVRDSRLREYGTCANAILLLEASKDEYAERIHPNLPITYGMIAYSMREEYAETVEDILARRTRALYIDAHASLSCVEKVAACMAREQNRSEQWTQQQIRNCSETIRRFI